MPRSWRDMQTGRRLRVTRDLPPLSAGVPSFPAGTIVHEYKGVLYGSLMDGEVAVTFEPGRTPFYGIPADAVEEV